MKIKKDFFIAFALLALFALVLAVCDAGAECCGSQPLCEGEWAIMRDGEEVGVVEFEGCTTKYISPFGSLANAGNSVLINGERVYAYWSVIDGKLTVGDLEGRVSTCGSLIIGRDEIGRLDLMRVR